MIRDTSRNTLWIVCILLLIVSFSIVLQSVALMNPDVALHVNVAQRILAGEKLYEDILDINLPMRIYLRIPAVWFAQYADISMALSSHIFTNVMVLISYGIVLSLLRATPLFQAYWRRIAFILMAAFVLFLLPLSGRNEFGQKEHLLLIFAFPYFAACYRRLCGLDTSVLLALLVGCLGGIGFIVKPYFLLFPIISELFLILKKRSLFAWLRPEILGMVMAGIASIAFFLPLWERYVQNIIPLASFYVLMSYNLPLLLFMSIVKIGFVLLPVVIFWKQMKQHVWFFYLCLLFAAGIGVALLQQKGWEYHYLPALAIGCLILADMTAVSISTWKQAAQRKDQRYLQNTRILGVYTALIVLLHLNGLPFTAERDAVRQRGMAEAFNTVVNRYAPDRNIYVLSEQIYAFPLVVMRDLQWHYGYYHLWPVIGVENFLYMQGESAKESEKKRAIAIKRMVQERVTRDLERNRPSVIVVGLNEKNFILKDKGVDYIEYFSEYPPFAQLMQQYELKSEILDKAHNPRFSVYVHKG